MSLNSPSNIVFFYDDLWKTGAAIEASSEHYNFPAVNTQKKWLTKSWQSSHGTGSPGGTFYVSSGGGSGKLVSRIYFTDSGGVITSIIASGAYTGESLAAEISSQMTTDSTLPQTYTCTYDVSTYKFTISASSNFTLHCNTQQVKAMWYMLGFDTTADKAGSNSYTSDYIRIHTEEWVKIGDGTPLYYTGLFILNHNVQTTGILKWQFSNNNFFSTSLEISPDRYGNVAAELYDAIQSYGYLRIFISDIDNPDGFVRIGRAWVSNGFVPDYGFAPGIQEPYDDLSKLKISEGGESSSILLPQLKNWNFDFDFGVPYKDFTETIRTFDEMFNIVGNTLPMVAVRRELRPDTNTFLYPERYTLYCRIKNWKNKQIAGEIRSVSMSLIEEK